MEVDQNAVFPDPAGLETRTIKNLPLPQVGIDPDPLPVQRSVSLPDSGSCADVNESLREWGADIIGGWSRSWQEWFKNGQGGDTCTRTIMSVRFAGTWEAR